MKQVFFVLVLLASIVTVSAQLQIGTRGSNDLIPQISISTNVVGQTATVTVEHVASQAQQVYLFLGTWPWRQDFTSYFGSGAWLMVRPSSSPSEFLILEIQPQGSLSFPIIGGLPDIYLQAAVIDPGGAGGLALSPSYAFHVAEPLNKALGSLPDPLVYAAASALDPRTGIMYVFGGLDVRYTVQDSIYSINPSGPIGYKISRIGSCPGSRVDARGVWDSRRNVAYFIGGGDSQLRNTIFEFNPDTGQCSLYDTLLEPIGRTAVVYDDSTGFVYIMGGHSLSVRDTVYLFNPVAAPGQRVTLLSVRIPGQVTNIGSAGRDPRTGAIYYLDNWGQRLLRFTPGGPAGGTFDILLSNIILPERPPTRPQDVGIVSYSTTFVPSINKFVMYGGSFGYNPSVTNFVYNNRVYAFDPINPSQNFQVLGYLPVPVEMTTASLDSITNTLLIGAGGHLNDAYARLLNKLIIFDFATSTSRWANSLPEGIVYGTAVRDPNTRRIFYIGGRGIGGAKDTVTIFAEDITGFPSSIVLQDRLPQPLSSAGAFWDNVRKRIYVFGGVDTNYQPMNAILEIDPIASPGNQVRVLPEILPQGLFAASVVKDAGTQKAYIFGGQGNMGLFSTIYEWDSSRPVGSRLQTLPVQLPSAGAYMAGAWSTSENAVYLLGGGTSAGYSNQILKFIPATGQMQRLTDQLPISVLYASATYDVVHNSFLIFGGDTQAGSSDKIYRYTPGSAPVEAGILGTPRLGTTAVFIPERDLTLVLGGNLWGRSFSDIWAFSLGS